MDDDELEARHAAYAQRLIDTIAEHGQAIQGVFPNEDGTGPQWAYTIGLSVEDHPEVITFSLPHEVAQTLLNDVSAMSRKEPIHVGYYDDIVKGFPVAFIEADPARLEDYVNQAKNLFGEDISILQMVWPDKAGLFPWDDGYSFGPEVQPLLGDPLGART